MLVCECQVLMLWIFPGHTESGSHLSLPLGTHQPAIRSQEVGHGTMPFLGSQCCCCHSGHLPPRCCSLPCALHSAASARGTQGQGDVSPQHFLRTSVRRSVLTVVQEERQQEMLSRQHQLAPHCSGVLPRPGPCFLCF